MKLNQMSCNREYYFTNIRYFWQDVIGALKIKLTLEDPVDKEKAHLYEYSYKNIYELWYNHSYEIFYKY